MMLHMESTDGYNCLCTHLCHQSFLCGFEDNKIVCIQIDVAFQIVARLWGLYCLLLFVLTVLMSWGGLCIFIRLVTVMPLSEKKG